MSEIKDYDQREFFSFIVELCGKLVILMTTYQIFVSNCGKNFISSFECNLRNLCLYVWHGRTSLLASATLSNHYAIALKFCSYTLSSRKKKRFKSQSSVRHLRPNFLHVHAEWVKSRILRQGFFSFSFVVELWGKLVILMTTYQMFISNYSKNFVPACREKII